MSKSSSNRRIRKEIAMEIEEEVHTITMEFACSAPYNIEAPLINEAFQSCQAHSVQLQINDCIEKDVSSDCHSNLLDIEFAFDENLTEDMELENFDELLNIKIGDFGPSFDRHKLEETKASFVSSEDTFTSSLAIELLQFFLMFNITEAAMKYLLCILTRHAIDVPKSLYLLKKYMQVSKAEIARMNVNNGSIAHLSIVENLAYLFSKRFLTKKQASELDLSFNIDGLPLYHSSNTNLWPILMTVKNSSYCKPLPISLFCGVGKPDFSQFLTLISDELKKLKSGIFFEDKFWLIAKKIIFLCDAPARSAVQFIKGHSGFFGCGYCKQKGERYHERTIFPSINSESRTDRDYLEMKENNLMGISPLLGIVPFFSAFPPDPMHVLYLGVTRKLFHYYFRSVKGLKLNCRLPNSQIIALCKDIDSFSQFFPSEFNRSIRPLNELEHFKASEFRNFLLYAAPFLFKPFLPLNYFRHFLLLHFSSYVFSSQIYCKSYFNQAKACMELFVTQCEALFGKQSIIYNIHTLSHLPHFVQLYGPLDSFSCFSYENYLSIVKRRIKSSGNLFEHSINTLLTIRDIFFSSETSSSVKYTSHIPNNCAILNDGRVIFIQTCFPDSSVSGYHLSFKTDLYAYPYPSHYLNIGIYKKTETVISGIPIQKCLLHPHRNDFIVFPLVSGELYVK